MPASGTTHDFYNDRKWITFIAGFAVSNNRIYIMYRAFIFFIFSYMIVMSTMACFYKPEKQLIVTAAHSILLNIFGIWALTTRILTYRDIQITRTTIRAGVYRYEDEERDKELMKLKESIPNEIHKKANIFLAIYILGALTNGILFPASQILLLDPESLKDSRIVHPYHPQLFYQPYDMRTRFGFLFGFLFGFVYFSILYAVAVGTNWMYISYAVQMKIHLRVLNYSIKNIQKRASLIYTRNVGKPTDDLATNKGYTSRTQEFERCLFLCLRSNIQHHQALLSFMKMFQPYYGSYILDLFTVASSVFGALLYLINQIPPINILLLLVVSFVAEQFSVIYVCMLGEEVITESQKVFTMLYDISWFNYGKRFNKILHTMMSNSRKPMGLKTLLFGIPASLEIYGNIISAMYKVSSLVRSSDAV